MGVWQPGPLGSSMGNHGKSHRNGEAETFLRRQNMTHLIMRTPKRTQPQNPSPSRSSCAAVRAFCLWFCSCHKVIKSMWHFYDIMTSPLLPTEKSVLGFFLEERSRQIRGYRLLFSTLQSSASGTKPIWSVRLSWNMISNKKQIKDDKNRVSAHAELYIYKKKSAYFLRLLQMRCEVHHKSEIPSKSSIV